MNKFAILRKLNKALKYNSIEEYIGMEIPLDISIGGGNIIKEIRQLIEENLNIKVKSTKGNDIEGTIAKYGIIDINFEIDIVIEPNRKSGIQILKDNAWVDKDSGEEYKEAGLGFLTDMIAEIAEDKTYLKIYVTSINLKEKSLREKAYLLKQVMRNEKMNPSSEDKTQVFRIDDMCWTNYSGIWLWKHFYM